MQVPITDRKQEIEAEQRLLLKADSDIEAGWNRLQSQQQLLVSLRSAGENTREAERLMHAMEETLREWERHRTLIEQRIAYLRSWPNQH